MSAPADLHELLTLLKPLGWVKRQTMPGLWRRFDDRHGQFIEPRDPGEVLVHGCVTHEPEKLFFQAMPLDAVVPFLTKMEET